MVELVSLKNVSKESKILILKELGYDSDGEFVLESDGKKVLDRYLGISIKLENMIILQGSEIILDNNELSISSYIEEFGNVF
jgi:hypothetical protein